MLKLHPGQQFWWQHWQRHGGQTGVYIVAECHWVLYWMNHPPIGFTMICYYIAAGLL